MKRWTGAVMAILLSGVSIMFSGCDVGDVKQPEWLQQELCDHVFEEEVVREPTCKQAGSTLKTCALCGLEKTVRVPAKGHNVAAIEGVAPTCETDGWTAGSYCTVCEIVLVEPTLIPASGHVDGFGNDCVVCGERIWTDIY
ncbi:MAG: hypothetical protein IJF39_03870 [Clostridia bacterium]|nr:hypothetical protein [Clostridia bacterium]